jgi:DNA-binding HxlR family transcriptional regulator
MKSENVTNGSKQRRWYRDACGTAVAMELIGERWSLLIMRELLLGPRRFGEIRHALPGLSANVLTQRLERLECDGILKRRTLPSPANIPVYELTRWGYSSEEAIFALSRWAAGSPAHDVTQPLSNTAFMLSLRTMMAADAGPLDGLELGFRVGGDPFRATIAGGRLAVRRDEPAAAPLRFAGEALALAATFYGPQRLAESQALGHVSVDGDLTLAQRFVDLFRLPAFVND